MKVFLAPLFFISSFCKHCVRSYYTQHPDEWIWQHELRRMPPLGYYDAPSGFTPDFPLLTMFDEFLITEEAHDRILAKSAPKWLGAWPNVIRLLSSEGALSTIDIDSTVSKLSPIRGGMLRREMNAPEQWADAMAYHDALMASADKAYGPRPEEAHSPTWAFDIKDVPGIAGSDGKSHMLSSAPLTEPGDNPADPHFQLHQLALNSLRMQLREVIAGVAISRELGAPPMLWAPYRRYLVEKSRALAELSSAPELAENAKLFFGIAFPRFAPDTVGKLARLRNNRDITHLRSEIVRAAEAGSLIDPDYPQRILEQAFHLERSIGKVRQVAGWISSALGLIPAPGLSVATTALSELAASAVEKRLKQPLKWFYLISDGTGHT